MTECVKIDPLAFQALKEAARAEGVGVYEAVAIALKEYAEKRLSEQGGVK